MTYEELFADWEVQQRPIGDLFYVKQWNHGFISAMRLRPGGKLSYSMPGAAVTDERFETDESFIAKVCELVDAGNSCDDNVGRS